MRKPQSGNKLDDDGRRSEQPVGNDNMSCSEIDARDILSAICHEHIKCAADARAKQDRRTQDVNIFAPEVIHGVLILYGWK